MADSPTYSPTVYPTSTPTSHSEWSSAVLITVIVSILVLIVVLAFVYFVLWGADPVDGDKKGGGRDEMTPLNSTNRANSHDYADDESEAETDPSHEVNSVLKNGVFLHTTKGPKQVPYLYLLKFHAHSSNALPLPPQSSSSYSYLFVLFR